MKCSKIKIKSLFGISEIELDGNNIEITGKKGTGKTSILDAIRYALNNSSRRDLIVRNGETEGEIIVETDTGLVIDRKKRTNKADFASVKENGTTVMRPETFLKTIFTPFGIVRYPLLYILAASRQKVAVHIPFPLVYFCTISY